MCITSFCLRRILRTCDSRHTPRPRVMSPSNRKVYTEVHHWTWRISSYRVRPDRLQRSRWMKCWVSHNAFVARIGSLSRERLLVRMCWWQSKWLAELNNQNTFLRAASLKSIPRTAFSSGHLDTNAFKIQKDILLAIQYFSLERQLFEWILQIHIPRRWISEIHQFGHTKQSLLELQAEYQRLVWFNLGLIVISSDGLVTFSVLRKAIFFLFNWLSTFWTADE